MEEEKIAQVFTVRGRPVGFRSGRWGGALVAMERGDFPISPTGYRSLSGLAAEAVTPDFLEGLAQTHKQEKESRLQCLREAQKPVGDPILNYIHVSRAYEQAVQYGFFATDRDRAGLWAGAHRLLCMVEADARFQPAPDRRYVAWKKEDCANALERVRELKAFLGRLAQGDFPVELPPRLFGVSAYLALPAKPGGEPRIELGGYTAEMALDLPTAAPVQRTKRRAAEPSPASPEVQLGLFGSPSVATKPASPAGVRPRLGNF